MLRIDLHLHSVFSDGHLQPEQLANRLKVAKVSVASLTDHDTFAGTELFMAACRRRSIRTVSGIELSAAYDGELHILGYRFDTDDAALTRATENCRQERDRRNCVICEKLRAAGLDISLTEVEKLAVSGVVGRPHIAAVMCSKGYVASTKEAFEKYLGYGASAYVPRTLLAAEECIALIRGAGGLPVMAHPLKTTPNLDDLPPLLAHLKECGLWGLECWSSCNKIEDTYRCLKIADQFDLYQTAGSDFHGKGHASPSTGVVVNEDLLPWAWFCGGL